MRNISAKADNVGDTLPASDFNANLRSEIQNAVTSAGFTLDPEGGPDTDVEMLGKSLTRYANAAQYYQDSGTANSYVLARVGNLKPLSTYLDGTTVMFKAGNSNTGASTINVDSVGSKALRDSADNALVGGEILEDKYIIARYNSGTDRFEIVHNQQFIIPDLVLPEDIGKSIVVADDGSGNPKFEVASAPGRNLLINTSVRVRQNLAVNYQHSVYGNEYPFDMVYSFMNTSGAADFLVSRSGDVPVLAKNYYSFSVSTVTQQASVAASDRSQIGFKVEGSNNPVLYYGSSDAKSMILSGWFKSTDTGNHSFYVQHQGTSASYPFQITINAASTWEFKTIIIPGDTTNSINYDTAASLVIQYCPMIGSNYYTSATNTWHSGTADRASAGDVNLFANASGYFRICDLKLELGEVATPYISRDIDDLFSKCRRHYEEWSGTLYVYLHTTTYNWRRYTHEYFHKKAFTPTISYAASTTFDSVNQDTDLVQFNKNIGDTITNITITSIIVDARI